MKMQDNTRVKYPKYFPSQPGFIPDSLQHEAFRYAWLEPMTDDSLKLAKKLKHSAYAIEHIAGLCHAGYVCHEAGHRLAETMRILKTDDPAHNQLKALHALHNLR